MSATAAKNKKQRPHAPATTGRGAAVLITLGMLLLTLGLAWIIAMLKVTDSFVLHQLLQILLGLCGPLCPTLPVLLIWGGVKLLVSARHRVSARHFFLALGIYLLVLAMYTLTAPGPQVMSPHISYLEFIRQQARTVGYAAHGEYSACLNLAYSLHTAGGGWLGMLIAYPLSLALTRVGGAIVAGALILLLLLLLFRVHPAGLLHRASAFGEKQRQRRVQKRQERMTARGADAPIYDTRAAAQNAQPTPPAWYKAAPIYSSTPPEPQPQPQPDEKGFYPVQPELYEERFPTEETHAPMEEPEWRKPVEPVPPVQPVQTAQPVPSPAPEKEKSGKLKGILNRLRETGPISRDMPPAREQPKSAPGKASGTASAAPAASAPVVSEPVPPAPAVQALDEEDDLPWDTEPAPTPVPKPAVRPAVPKPGRQKADAPAPAAAPASEMPAPLPSWAAQVSRKKAQLEGKNEPQQVFTDPVMPLTGEKISIKPGHVKEPGSGDRLDGTGKPTVRQAAADDLIPYEAPPIRLLKEGRHVAQADAAQEDERRAQIIEGTLRSFGVESEVKQIMHGPSITRFAIQIAPGVKVNKVANTSDNLALELKTPHVRVESPIQGTNYIGIEVPNKLVSTVALREVLDSPEMKANPSPLLVALGKDIAGSPVLCDLSKMPHLLIAGATGSGKSVCINSIVCSLLYRTTPEQVRLIMVDPKQVELSVYNTVPHLLVPVVSDPKKAAGALAWVVQEMLERYGKFSAKGVRNLAGYNKAIQGKDGTLPNIVVIIDEMADLMEVCRKDVEESIRRLAALARAAGIYMVLATQRPSVDVITGVVKNNIPSRIAFAVSSGTDSRTIIDINGAEKLMGKGDMLYKPTGASPIRVQGCFVSDDEVNAVAEYIGSRYQTDFDPNIVDHLENTGKERDADEISGGDEFESGGSGGEGSFSDLLQQAIEMAVEDGQTSTSMLQRRLRVGYARAGRLIDEMEKRGIISQSEGSKPRKTLVTREQYAEMMRDA